MVFKNEENQNYKHFFHLNNHHANQKIENEDKQLPPELTPKYLGVTLNRTLAYEKHIENIAQKPKSRHSILQKLTGTSWGAY